MKISLKNTIIFLAILAAVSPFAAIAELDRSKYIGIDEIKPGMEAYCLTVYKGTEVEKFPMKVLDVVYNARIGCDEILVEGLDERFIHTGPVHGCSGSPVYIDGRIAGALARGWAYCKDPLYRVTAIEDMLKIGQNSSGGSGQGTAYSFDVSGPIDLAAIESKFKETFLAKQSMRSGDGQLGLPVLTSGINAVGHAKMNEFFQPMGMFSVDAGISGSKFGNEEPVKLSPGSSLAVPLVSGDISITVLGTVTDVQGNDVLAFGHQFLGYGDVDLPIATAKVHTVVSNVVGSFKMGSALETLGTLNSDGANGVRGTIGTKARTIPLHITIENCNDMAKREYNCEIAYNRELTPMILATVLSGAATVVGELPMEHRLDYSSTVITDTGEVLNWSNASSARQLQDVLREAIGAVAVMMNNPFGQIGISSLEFNIKVTPKNDQARITSARLLQSHVKSGQKINVEAVVEQVNAISHAYRIELDVPKNMPAGQYSLIITGGEGYLDFLRKSAPHRFIAFSTGTLMNALQNTMDIKRDNLYCILMLPPGGVTLQNSELPYLPASKAMVFDSAARTVKTQPFQNWVSADVPTAVVVTNREEMLVTIEN